MNSEVILKVTDLKTHFDVTKGMFSKKQIVKAVDGVSFEIHKVETFGLVGESGCGKSTLLSLIHIFRLEEDAKEKYLEYDPEEAKALLAKAGYDLSLIHI